MQLTTEAIATGGVGVVAFGLYQAYPPLAAVWIGLALLGLAYLMTIAGSGPKENQ